MRNDRLALCLLVVGAACSSLAAVPARADDEKSAVSPNRLKLPKGPGSLEGVGENVEPNLSMGLMSYGIPIDLPAGHNGHSPSLRLAYSSGAGNSAVGIGWSLAVPSIERMTVRGLPRYGADDLVAAGGSDELVAVEREPDHIVYRARFEGGFVRYTWFHPGSGGYWLAEYPDGKRGYFGATHDGRTVDTANVAGSLGTFRWQLVELLDTLDHRVVYEYERNLYGDSRLRTIRWVERADGTFRYGVRLDYEGRRDEISDAKPGFDLRCDRRVARVTVLNDGRQMRAWGLHYDDATGLSRLVRVDRFGTQNARPFPVVFTFAYTGGLGLCAGDACQVPRMGTIAGGLPGAFADGNADFIDINGDSLPDILDTSGPRHAFRLNGGEFDGVLAFGGPDPSDLDVSVSLGDPGVQPLDVDGNGTSDLIFGRGADARVLWNRGGGDWAAGPEPLDGANLPDFGAAGDAFRFLDVDHDRRIDLLFSSAGGTEVLFNRNAAGGLPGFAAPAVTEDAIGADFSGNGVQLADMNGDALADPVFRTDSGASYRLNLGRGRFSDWIPMATEARDDIPDSAQFVDLNGDGLSDLVSVESGAVRVWLNSNGRAFDTPLLIDDGTLAGQGDHIPEADANLSHRFLDINGNGSTDVVWVRPGGESVYLDLFPVRPNLLATIDNGIGDTIAMTYGNSTAHALEEGADSRLPSPGITVDRIVRTTQQVTEDWVAPHEQVFHYAAGLYDGLEHQFRGFERVRVETPGDADTEGSRADHVFDVGRDDDGEPDAYRKGLLIARDVLSGEGLTARLIERTESTYGDCDLAGVPAETDPPIRWVCQRSTAKTHIETPPADAAPMPAPDPVRTEENYAYDGYGNRIRTEKLGVVARNEVACGAACSGDELYEETTFVAPDRTGGRWLLRAPCVARTYGRPGSPQQTETRTYYDDPPELGAPECTLTRGLKARGTQKRFEDRDETVTSERNTYDAHGNVIVTRDANGHRRTFAYDADALLPVAETAWLDDAGRAAPYGLVTRVTYDRTLDLVDTSVDWRIVRDDAVVTPAFTTRYRYDEFGRLTSIQHPDDRELPSETWTYDLRAPVSRIVKQARTQLGGGFDLAQVQCFDGRGRAFGSLGLVSPGRYLATGVTRPNVLSGAAESFQPFETNTDACAAPPAGILSTRSRYDGQGRLLGTLEPDGSTTRTEYRPLEVAAFDEEDTDQNSRQHFNTPTRTFTDGLGRTVRIERIADRDRDSIPLRLTYDELGRLRGYIDAEGHEKVQTFDLLGRVLRVDDPDSGRTTFEYDAVGNRLATQDARGATVRTEFDELNRPVAEYATWPAAGEVRADTEVRTAYDDEAACEDFAQGAGTCTHSAGRTVRVTYPLFGWQHDGADAAAATGEDVFGYDARGQAVRTVRRLDRHVFEFETRYDSAGRVVANTYPDGERVDQTLDGLGRLVAVPGYIDAVDYNTQGLPTRITHVGGLSERHAYDQRLREVAYGADSPGGGPLVSRTLTRTPTGNIVGIADALARPDAPSGNAQYAYDSLYRLTSARLDPGAPADERLDWTYDDLDRINAATSDRPGSRAHVGRYTYGEAAGPNAVTSTDDDHGNITRYRYDDAGFMTLHGQDAYLWDARGRMTLVRRGAAELGNNIYGPGVDRVAVRKGNRVSAWYPHPAFEVRDGVTTKYVSLGTRRVVKIERAEQAARWLSDLAPATVVLGVASPVGDESITGADAWMALAVAAGVLDLPEETRTDDVDALLQAAARRVALRDAPRVTRLLHDHLGTLIATTDARGGLLTRVEHYPYGLERWSSDGRGDDYEYTGKEYDADTGLTYFGARYLEPRLGRWVSPDPKFQFVRQASIAPAIQAATRFSYVLGNPITRTDSVGEVLETIIDVVSLGLSVKALHDTLKDPDASLADKLLAGAAVAVDTLAVAVPFLPGGAGLAMKGAKAAGVARKGSIAHKTRKAVDTLEAVTDGAETLVTASDGNLGEAVLGAAAGNELKKAGRKLDRFEASGAKGAATVMRKARDVVGAKGISDSKIDTAASHIGKAARDGFEDFVGDAANAVGSAADKQMPSASGQGKVEGPL